CPWIELVIGLGRPAGVELFVPLHGLLARVLFMTRRNRLIPHLVDAGPVAHVILLGLLRGPGLLVPHRFPSSCLPRAFPTRSWRPHTRRLRSEEHTSELQSLTNL